MALTFEQYISQFENLDEYGEYGERLKEELKDHFEESSHAGMVFGQSETEAQQKAIQKLGEPKKIIHEFKIVMKFNNKHTLWMESLFFGIVSIPVMQFGFLIFAVLTGMYTNEIFPKSIVGGYILSYLLVFALFSGFYFLVARRVFRFLENKKRILSFGIGLFSLPFLFALNFTDWSLSLRGEFGFLQYLLFVLIPAIISFSTVIWIFNKKRESLLKQKQEKKLWQKIASWIPFVIAVIFIPCILLTNQAFVGMDSSVNRSFVDFMSFVRGGIEYINIPIIDFHLNGMFGGNEGFYLFGIIYIFLAIVSLYHIAVFFLDKSKIRNIQSLPWLSVTLLVYIFSLFFLVKPTPAPSISWHVPAVNISEEIKKDQLGLVYRPVMYFESLFLTRQKAFFLYEIDSQDNYFQIVNPDNEGGPIAYYLGFSNPYDSFTDLMGKITVQSDGPLLGLELSTVSSPSNEPFFHGALDLPKDVTCKTNINKTIRYTDNPDDTSYCHELYYQGKLIYTQDHAEALYQFEIMPQYSQYALIKLNHGEYGPQTVYLIKVTE